MERKKAVTLIDIILFETSVFVTIDNLESLYYLKKGKYTSFFQQMLIDCNTYDNSLVDSNLDWFKENGIESDSDYPYIGYKSSCKAEP